MAKGVVENFGIDTSSIGRATIELHINKLKEDVWKKLFRGKRDLPKEISIY